MSDRINRRDFLKTAAAGAAAGFWILENSKSVRGAPANEKLNIALIGVGNQGRTFIRRIPAMGHNLVAICDVNQLRIKALTESTLTSATQAMYKGKGPGVSLSAGIPQYRDFRKMLDEMDRQIDAVVVATPHHTQPVITAAIMKRGKHVYCEKPIAHNIGEARLLRQIAQQQKVVTQMGNQGISSDQFRRVLELVQQGAIGEIRESTIWFVMGGAGSRDLPTEIQTVPETLDWDLFLGPASKRPYHQIYVSGWSRWRDFGTGTLGMCCTHALPISFKSMNLAALWDGNGGGKTTIRVEARVSEIVKNCNPRWENIEYEFPARGAMPPAKIHIYNAPEEYLRNQPPAPPAADQVTEKPAPQMSDEPGGILGRLEKMAGGPLEWKDTSWTPKSGSLVVGSKGMVHTNAHNSDCVLLPEKDFANQSGPPQTMPRSGNHEKEWATAIKGGPKPISNFIDYAGQANELIMLGNIATLIGQPLEYDPVAGKIINNEEANKLIMPARREGWEI